MSIKVHQRLTLYHNMICHNIIIYFQILMSVIRARASIMLSVMIRLGSISALAQAVSMELTVK